MSQRLVTALVTMILSAMGPAAFAQSAAPGAVQFVTPSPEAIAAWSPHARTSFEAGVGAVRVSQWGNAADAFRASLATESHPEALIDLAVVERARGHFRAARDALDQLTAIGAAPDPAAVQQTIHALTEHLAALDLNVTPESAIVSIDGERSRAGEVELDEGTHVITVEAPGYVRHAASFSIRAGERMTMAVRLRSRTNTRAWIWAGMGAGSALATALTIVGAVLANHSPTCSTLMVCMTGH